jgi:hypothetical protein
MLSVSNKAQMAQIVAAQFPELRSRLPPERKPWMTEDTRMATFDAAAFGLTFAVVNVGFLTLHPSVIHKSRFGRDAEMPKRDSTCRTVCVHP